MFHIFTYMLCTELGQGCLHPAGNCRQLLQATGTAGQAPASSPLVAPGSRGCSGHMGPGSDQAEAPLEHLHPGVEAGRPKPDPCHTGGGGGSACIDNNSSRSAQRSPVVLLCLILKKPSGSRDPGGCCPILQGTWQARHWERSWTWAQINTPGTR